MNTPTITTRVADLIRNPNSAMPSEWEYSKREARKIDLTKASATESPKTPKAQNAEFKAEDNLSLSPLAQKILENSDTYESDWDKIRSERVQRVQQLVQEKQYVMNPETIDEIAQKIVSIFA
jgi:anti-sigma28 factor (negative regulator of flagellin synthesis)